jgi:hypothetical protein
LKVEVEPLKKYLLNLLEQMLVVVFDQRYLKLVLLVEVLVVHVLKLVLVEDQLLKEID